MSSNNKEFYEKQYLPKMHRIGTITGCLGVLFAFAPAIVLAIVYGLLPQPSALLTAFIAAATSFGLLWVIEPISYFPVLGPVGTYMAFLSGNISNMRVPCASRAQMAAGVEPGSEEGSIVASLGMAVSIILNVSILTIGVIAGSSILAMLPAKVTEALNYLLPALFGALFIQFAMKSKQISVIMIIFGCLVNLGINVGIFSWIPGASNWLSTLSCVFVAIGVGMAMSKKDAKKEA